MAEGRFHIPQDRNPTATEDLRNAAFQFNSDATGIRDAAEVSKFRYDESGKLIAGIYGWVWGTVYDIELLWVADSLRGNGIGASCWPGRRRALPRSAPARSP